MSSIAPQAKLTQPTRVALFQLAVTADKAHNLEHGRKLVLEELAAKPADLVVLPEVWQSPYGVQHFAKYAEDFGDLWKRVKPAVDASSTDVEKRWGVDGLEGGIKIDDSCKSETLKLLSSLAKETGTVLVGGSIPERDAESGKLYNTSSVFNQQGELISLFRKVHLFDIDVPGMKFQESLTLSPGDRLTVFECSLGRFGLAICYDLRFPEQAQVAARLGAGAMIYPGAFNTTTGPVSWELLLRSRATDNQLYTLGCSPARPSSEAIEAGAYPAWGHSSIVDPWARVLATTDEKEAVVRATLEPEVVQKCRMGVPIGRQRRFDLYPNVATAPTQ